jgi:hypothetical protein
MNLNKRFTFTAVIAVTDNEPFIVKLPSNYQIHHVTYRNNVLTIYYSYLLTDNKKWIEEAFKVCTINWTVSAIWDYVATVLRADGYPEYHLLIDTRYQNTTVDEENKTSAFAKLPASEVNVKAP